MFNNKKCRLFILKLKRDVCTLGHIKITEFEKKNKSFSSPPFCSKCLYFFCLICKCHVWMQQISFFFFFKKLFIMKFLDAWRPLYFFFFFLHNNNMAKSNFFIFFLFLNKFFFLLWVSWHSKEVCLFLGERREEMLEASAASTKFQLPSSPL